MDNRVMSGNGWMDRFGEAAVALNSNDGRIILLYKVFVAFIKQMF